MRKSPANSAPGASGAPASTADTLQHVVGVRLTGPTASATVGRVPASSKRLLAVLPIAVPTAVLAGFAIGGVYAKLGHAGATLDDSFIHFQYARALAELHPFRYQAGEPHTMGATSLLWPVLLAPFYAIGFRDVALVWPAWILSFVALGLLAHEAFHLTKPLAGKTAAVGAACMVLAFSGFSWCAASGMEVVPFAWLLARSARRASEWSEGTAQTPTPEDRRRRLVELLALAFLTPLMRPEGALASLLIGATLIAWPEPREARGRFLGVAALAAPLLPMAVSYALTGSARSNAAIVKLLIGNPYASGPALTAAVAANVRTLVGTLLNGTIWSAEFLPRGGAPIAIAGLGAIVLRGVLQKTRWRALCVTAIAVAIAVPCLYSSFLWNRLRYLWPFATGWLVGLACLSRALGDACASVHARWRIASPLACGVFVGALGVHQGWALDDVADSASGIERQHIRMGRWAKENLSAGARIGVNDTGAIAYFSDHRTFDIVGLTTKDEARYWIAGPASRLEHYERLYARSPDLLPTHFIVYPEWMACDPILGKVLFEATVRDATILGGTTMIASEADYSRLGSGERPWTQAGEIVDTLDVADLESEAEHAYDLAGTRDGEQVVRAASAPDGSTVLDGGRGARAVERFIARTRTGLPTRGIVRLEASVATRIVVRAGATEVASFEATDDEWREYTFVVPAQQGGGTTSLELRPREGALTVFHYWFDSGG
jgi:hypothetical protein